MTLRVKAISDRVDLDTNPPEIYVLLTLTDGTRTVDLPLGPDAHNALFTAFPSLLANARNATPAATSVLQEQADQEVYDDDEGEDYVDIPDAPMDPEPVRLFPQQDIPEDDALPGGSAWTPAPSTTPGGKP
jgi:hypothetical protein